MNFEAVIGLEIHVEVKTKSKMFSSAPNKFSSEHNINVSPIDMAFPGIMPTVNKQVVIDAIRVCNALHMSIDNTLIFDRKNYFYSDLPKGYQITQQYHPIGKDGYLLLDIDGNERKIEIERLHMEEDTCKQLHMVTYTLLDYNRAGVPLLEIVSRPQIKNGLEAMKYVEEIRNIVIYAGVSDGKMEEGSLRCDVNVSIRPCGATYFGTKVEIKNLNSLANVQRAIDFEMDRQSKLILKGLDVKQETRRFDETKKETVLMREKTDSVDYKYFTEPNITPIKLSDEFIEKAISSCPELLSEKRKRYIKEYGLSEYDSDVILSDINTSKYFEEVVKYTKFYKLAANWINVDVAAYLNKNVINIANFSLDPKDLAFLIDQFGNNKISSKSAKEIFNEILENKGDLRTLCEKASSSSVNDEDTIRNFVDEIIKDNPQIVLDYKNGKTRAVGFIIGQLMKKTQGKANPSVANKIVVEELNKN